MKTILKLVSLMGLLITIVPSFLVFADVISLDTNKLLMILGTLFWFISVPFWMDKKVE